MSRLYKDTLDWMFAQLPMYQQQGKTALNAKLDNIKALAARLGHPEKKFRSIHVAGTNGKGSSSHMLASILQEAGYKTGLYTSPHLKDFRERIRIDGVPIGKDFVIDFISSNQNFFEEHRLSFFEMTVGMAFACFAQERVDIAIIEVGLGGRLDSTNILVPEVALITNIGLDHIDLLGNTLEKIAYEKAGIIKAGVPVVISEYREETAAVFESVAGTKGSEIMFAEKTKFKEYKTSLLGDYQKKNIKGVVAVLRQLNGFRVEEIHIERGLLKVQENTGLMGRWQVLRVDPKVVCDTAHNREGLSDVLRQISQQKFQNLHMVLGFVKEKDLDNILPLFPPSAIYYFCRPQIPRGLDAQSLQEKASSLGLKGNCFPSVDTAYSAALVRAESHDFVFIGGSNFTVAEVL